MTRFASAFLPGRLAQIFAATAAGVAALAQPAAQAAEACVARSSKLAVPVVELYTSEGCNSCPPADKWLSKLKADPAVVALAFHVDYWDRLGWKDRFASSAFTDRQATQQKTNGARFSYTPQVVVDGKDRTDWSSISSPGAIKREAPVEISLTHEGNQFVATVAPGAGAPKKLAAYWAVTEQGHVTAVKAGENDGVTLHHDYVVRDYKPVPAWAAQAVPETLRFSPLGSSDPAHPRQVNLVVVDADTGRPVQAVKVGC